MIKRLINLVVVMVFSALLLGGSTSAGDGNSAHVDYPEGYRNWTHVKSMVILPGHSLEDPFMGIHHIYGNEAAIEGYTSGDYEDGSVIVFDLLEFVKDENSINEGKRKLVGVMVRDSEAYTETGGWGFEGFAGNSKSDRLTSDGGKSCFACHQSQKDKDYVFSEYRN